MPEQENITELLLEFSNGKAIAVDALLPIVYDELKRLASNYLRRERSNHTLQPTALVYEAYIRLIDQTRVNWQNRAHFFGIAANVMRRAAKEAAQKAVTLDENLAEGYAALGFAVLMHDLDWAQAEKHLRRAVELNPNYVTGLIWYCCFLGVKGESEEAFKQIRHALKLDPLTPIVPHTLNLTLYYAGNFEEAIAGGEKLVEREPRYGLAQLFLSSVMWKVGRTDEAVRLANRAVLLLGRTPYSLAWLTSAYAASGETGKARDLIAEIEESSVRRYVSPYLLAVAYANLRNTEKTLELLEKAAEIRDGRLIWLGVDPQFDEFRGHPRFDKVLRKTNNPLVAAHV